MRCRPLVLGLLALVALALAGTAAAAGGFDPVPPHSPNASRIESDYWLVFGIAAAIFILVETALVVFVIRFRSRGRGREVEGPQIHGHARTELIWTAIPVLILAAIAAFTFYKLPGIKNTPSAGAAGTRLDVDVQGRQFYWEFTYPNGVISVDRMRAPEGRVVNLDVNAPDFDVIHSWWIPALGGKIDAIPGNPNQTWFQADETGTYKGRCAEFCGLYHADMSAAVEVLPPAEFDRWLAAEARAQTEGTSDLGKQTFDGVCAKCHGMQGQGGVGPELTGNPIITDKAGLTTLLENGGKTMPAVGRGWSDTQLNALLDYLSKNVAKAKPSGG